MKKIVTVLKWTAVILAAAFSLLVIIRIPHVIEVQKTGDIVAKIHATKLTLDDVMGKNLPPDPGANADKTVAGIDANNNGIRDDVELAIFKEYPNSAKTRAVLLQYALVLQMQMTMPVLNKETVTASVEDNESRANICMWNLSTRDNLDKFMAEMRKYNSYIKTLQINTGEREKYVNGYYKDLGSYSASNGGCDIDLSTLIN